LDEDILIKRTFAATLVLLLLTGCLAIAPTVSPTAQPEANSAYVAGIFSRNKGVHFALVLHSTDGNDEYIMPMGEETRLATAISESSIAIAVRPGTYVISEWMTYAPMSKQLLSRYPNRSGTLAKPFVVAIGSVTHLGKFESEWAMTYTGIWSRQHNMRVHPVPNSTPTVQASFANAHPKLALQPFNCVFCMDTVPLP
jgi:hypothetical protein